MSQSGPPTKRPKWSINPNACDLCRRRKSKCRVSSTTGACDRCRETMQRCSLQIGDIDEPGESNVGISPASGTGCEQASRERGEADLRGLTIDNRRILLRLDERTRGLEKALRHVQHLNQQLAQRLIPTRAMLASRVSYGEREDGIGDDDDLEESVSTLLNDLLGTSLLYVTGMNLHDQTTFLDPVGMAVISAAGMRSSLERFHDYTDLICPMRELFDAAVDSDNAFLRSCVLPYLSFAREGGEVDSHEHRTAQAILDDNIARLHASNPSNSIIAGLAIASISPANGFEKRYVRKVDGGFHIQRAMDMALAHGLDDAASSAQRQTMADLASAPWLQSLRLKTLLWYLVAHRATWVDILSSPSMSPRPFRSPPITAVFTHCREGTPLLRHLFHEARLFSMLEKVTSTFRRVRQTVAHEPNQLRGLWVAMMEYWTSAVRWREGVLADKVTSGPLLVYTSLLVDILLCFKCSTDCVTRAPAPLGPTERITFMRDCLQQHLTRSVDCIDYAVTAELDLAIQPAFHLTLAFLPFRILRAASLIDPVSRGPLAETENYMRYRNMLVTSHPLGAGMVQNIEAHQPTRSWESFVSKLADTETVAAGENDGEGVDAFVESLWAMCAEDNFIDFAEFQAV